ncbi:MAG: hypothetical protein ACI89X_001303 [Planctomycetota bacterium]|jgi:hypothetical protein
MANDRLGVAWHTTSMRSPEFTLLGETIRRGL